MKLNYILGTVLIFFTSLSACKKGEDTSLKSSRLTFSLGGFKEDTISMSKASGAKISGEEIASNTATDSLYYLVYLSSGSLVKKRLQVSTSPSYGTLQDTLPNGSYEIYFLASKGALNFVSESFSYQAVCSPASGQWNDLFLKKIILTVNGNAVQQHVQLERAIGAIEVELLDAIPVGVTSIKITCGYDSYEIGLKDGLPRERTAISRTYPISVTDEGKTNKKFFMHSVNGGYVVVSAWKGNEMIASKFINMNVISQRNKVSRLYGRLF